ncbi:MAG TPA: hypothetical protein VF783_20375 [Terriglobales bacterium]
MPFERNALTVLVDREDRIAISHAGVVDPLVFEADINALLSVQLILPTSHGIRTKDRNPDLGKRRGKRLLLAARPRFATASHCETVTTQQDAVERTDMKLEHGVATRLDVLQAQQVLDTANARIPKLERQIGQLEDAISDWARAASVARRNPPKRSN